MKKDEIWTTRDERKISVGEMEDSHVRNTLRMLLRNRRRNHDQRLQPIARDENMPASPYTDPVDDEMWVNRGGHEIPVNQMTDEETKNALRQIIRATRRAAEKKLYDSLPVPDDSFFERPDNHTILSGLRRQHGDAVKVERSGMGGISGGNVYIDGQWYGWFGGI